MHIKFLPKFVTVSSQSRRHSTRSSIYAVIGIRDEKGEFLWAMDTVDGKMFALRRDSVIACQYSEKMVWGVNGDWIYYNSNSLRAERINGPAASIDGKKIFCWKGCVTFNKEKFFEYLSKEEKLEAAFNLDEF